MPFFFDQAHYRHVANLLTAMEVEASTFKNPVTAGIKVKLENGSVITWSNSEHQHWALTICGPDGFIRGEEITALPMEAPVEDVATFIARFNYAVVMGDKTVEQERALRDDPVTTEEV